MHRDIKSKNVLYNSEGEVKLSDLHTCALLTEDHDSRQTTVGTPWFMAPELIEED